MAKTMSKYWYTSPIDVVLIIDREKPYRMTRTDIVQGSVVDGDTKATSKLRVISVNGKEVWGEVLLPLDRFKEVDVNDAYMED